MASPVGHLVVDLIPERHHVLQERLLELLQDVVGPPPGGRSLAVTGRHDAPRQVVVAQAVREFLVAGLPEQLLGDGEVVHRPARAVMERDEVAVCSVEVLDAQFDFVERLAFAVGQAVVLHRFVHDVRYHLPRFVGCDDAVFEAREARRRMDASIRAGVAIYNAGEYHAAHDAWEESWLALGDGTDDERFLHGLIQFTAAVYHARTRNWSGATGLAESAGDYLAGLPSPYRGVDLDPVRRALVALAADPEVIERRRPPPLRYEGHVLALDDLRFEAAAVAARVLAEADGYDAAPIERAITFAREEIEGGERTLFTTTLMEFVTADATRSLVYRRLADHVERREREYADVDGLFEE